MGLYFLGRILWLLLFVLPRTSAYLNDIINPAELGNVCEMSVEWNGIYLLIDNICYLGILVVSHMFVYIIMCLVKQYCLGHNLRWSPTFPVSLWCQNPRG